MKATQTALIVVDLQRDFCIGGSLPVKDGDKVVPPLNNTIKEFRKAGLPVFFTRDWHPPNHCSFKNQGGMWPSHCVQGTEGATFHPELDLSSNPLVISKGTNPKIDAYSGFQGTDLEWRLRTYEVNRLFIGGLTTDYCVKQTSIDARHAGFEVYVLKDCVRAVEANRGDGERALKEMKKAGVRLTNSASAVYRLASPASPAPEEE